MSTPLPYVVQVDVTHSNVHNLPPDLIAVAGYVTGTSDIVWDAADFARFPLAGKVRIDQSPGLRLFAEGDADMADLEAGAGTIGTFLDAARQRAAAHHQSAAYISYAGYPDLLAEVKADGLVPQVRYFIANWNWSAAQAVKMLDDNGPWAGVQFASPSSNPGTLVPGSSLTLAEANADLSVKRASWFGSAALAGTGWSE